MIKFVKAGLYIEKMHIADDNTTLLGEGAESTIISYGDYAKKIHEDGNEYGTFRSQSVYVSGNDFCARDISFVNSAGKGRDVGQAVAFYADGDRHSFYNCKFEGHQDTLFMSPLPTKPALHRLYFENCEIRGDVDFIFGGAIAYFQNCVIISNDLQQETNGYITAASTPEGHKHGFVFNQCRLISDAAPSTVYLGRPWRNFAKTVFINCYMGAHIKPEGWHNWDKPEAERDTFYAEYGSHGPGGDMSRRVPWAKHMDEANLSEYTAANVLNGWIPQ